MSRNFSVESPLYVTYPYLELDALVVLVNGLDLEVDADRTDEGRGERVVGVAEQEGRLADRAVSDNQQLEHVVEVLIRRVAMPTTSHAAGHFDMSAAVPTVSHIGSVHLWN